MFCASKPLLQTVAVMDTAGISTALTQLRYCRAVMFCIQTPELLHSTALPGATPLPGVPGSIVAPVAMAAPGTGAGLCR